MNWLDLYNFLHQRANDLKNLGSFNWQAPVEVFDNQYGETSKADLIELYDDFGNNQFYIKIDSGDN
jgi:hypothetical protein